MTSSGESLMPLPVLIHVILMSLATIVVLPVSIYVANTRHTEPLYEWIDRWTQSIKSSLQLVDRKDLYAHNKNSGKTNDSWFHLHNTLTFAATFVMILGWISIFLFNADSTLAAHVGDWHHIVGAIVILVSIFVQPKLGTTTSKRDVADRWKHRYLGRVILCGTAFSVITGWGILFDKYLPV